MDSPSLCLFQALRVLAGMGGSLAGVVELFASWSVLCLVGERCSIALKERNLQCLSNNKCLLCEETTFSQIGQRVRKKIF